MTNENIKPCPCCKSQALLKNKEYPPNGHPGDDGY